MSSTYHKRLKQIRFLYPRAYEKWAEFDDILLRQEFLNGKSISQLSELFHRQPSAIKSRIRKLGIVANNERQEEKVPKDSFMLVKGKIDEDNTHSLGTDFQFHWTAVFREPEKEYLFPESISPYMLENYKYPSIYRWIVYKAEREQIQYAYIGTTKQLCPERLAGYLFPNSSNTNLRLNQEFQRLIRQGYKIGLESLQVEQIKINNTALKFNNLNSQTARIFIENLLIFYYRQKGLILLNKQS